MTWNVHDFRRVKNCHTIVQNLTRINPKSSDTWKNCCNLPKIWTRWLHHRIMPQKGADGMANSVDSGQTALIWVYTVCPDLSVRKLGIITVFTITTNFSSYVRKYRWSYSPLAKSKKCMFRVTRPYLNLLVKPGILFQVFWKIHNFMHLERLSLLHLKNEKKFFYLFHPT